MDMIPVVSSNVASIGYENGKIEVLFRSGYIYQYPNCNEQLFQEFLNASSKGKFLNRYLKGTGETRIC